jgi:hypothetical protein
MEGIVRELAVQYVRALHTAGLLYHFEDCAIDCLSNTNLSKCDCQTLNELTKAFTDAGVDLCGIAISMGDGHIVDLKCGCRGMIESCVVCEPELWNKKEITDPEILAHPHRDPTTCSACGVKDFPTRGSEYCEECERVFAPEKYDAEAIFNGLVADLEGKLDDKGVVDVVEHIHNVIGEWLLHRVKGE